MIPYGRQEITDADIAAVVDVLHSDFLTQGPVVPRFEQAVAGYCGAPTPSPSTAPPRRCISPAWRLGVGPGDTGVDQPDHLRRQCQLRTLLRRKGRFRRH